MNEFGEYRQPPQRRSGTMEPILLALLICAALHIVVYLIAPQLSVLGIVKITGAQCISYHFALFLPPALMAVTAVLALTALHLPACITGCITFGVQAILFMLSQSLLIETGAIRRLDLGGYSGPAFITLGWGAYFTLLMSLAVAVIAVLIYLSRRTVVRRQVEMGDQFESGAAFSENDPW